MTAAPGPEPGTTSPRAAPMITLRGLSLPGTSPPGTRLSWARLPGHGPHRAAGHRARHGRHGAPGAVTTGPVDLTVRRGELVLVGGRAGAGKSALLHVIALLLRPASGTYLLDGIDTATLRDRDRAALRGRQIGIVFQHPSLLPARSALENVMLPLLYAPAPDPRRRRTALDALDRVGMADQAGRLAWTLSAAERQRVAIARAIVARPALLLCDDPTASLDAQAAAQTIGLLTALHRDGVTVLVASRDRLAAAYASRLMTVGGDR